MNNSHNPQESPNHDLPKQLGAVRFRVVNDSLEFMRESLEKGYEVFIPDGTATTTIENFEQEVSRLELNAKRSAEMVIREEVATDTVENTAKELPADVSVGLSEEEQALEDVLRTYTNPLFEDTKS